jgi:hypothetical protein
MSETILYHAILGIPYVTTASNAQIPGASLIRCIVLGVVVSNVFNLE